jgi:hypothetical protein
MFKRNLAGLIDKIRKVERTGISMEAEQTQAQANQKEEKASDFRELMDTSSSQVLRNQEARIREGLKSKRLPNDQETIALLIRTSASLWLSLRWEQIDRLIFGSQLNALVVMNASALGLTMQQVGGFYEAAVAKSPDVYKNFPVEQWLQFLETHQLIIRGGNGVQITIDGKEFMVWLVNTGKTHVHPH